MAMELDEPYKQGYLWIPPNGQVKKKFWQKKFCQLFYSTKRGVDRLEIYDSKENASKIVSVQIVTLEDCIKITQDPQKTQNFVFTVVTKTKNHYFAGSSESDMLDWISAFQSVAFPDSTSRQTIEEDNELYCSSGGDVGVYKVTLVPTEASQRCELIPGDYTLVVSPTGLDLRQIIDNNLLFTWPYRFIRRFGQKKGERFTFEAGRKCLSGEGTFVLEHRSPQDIFRMMHYRMDSIKQLLSSRDNLLGDSQFHHALGMHARSRSPLPPSPTSTTPIPLPPRKPPRMHPPSSKIEIAEHSPVVVPKIEIKEFDSKDDSWKSIELSQKVFSHEKILNNYDQLNHFGTIPRLNDPSYAQVSFSADWSSPQIAEDHGGYGIIRRKKIQNHAISDDLEYAVVCKPHRV